MLLIEDYKKRQRVMKVTLVHIVKNSKNRTPKIIYHNLPKMEQFTM